VIFGALALVAFQAWMLSPLHATMDLPAWDESTALGAGAEFAAGSGTLGELSSSPLYVLLYAPLNVVFGRLEAFFAAKYLLTVVTSGLLFLFLARAAASVTASFLLSALWVLSRTNLASSLLVYHFGLLLFLAALLACRRSRLVALALLFLATLARLEYLFVALPYAVHVWRAGRDKPLWPGCSSAAALAACAITAGFTLAHVESWNVGGKRSWHAFRQHYALAQVEAGRARVNPWTDYDEVIARDFPGSDSTLGALVAHPRPFLLHAGRNLVRFPGAALQLLVPYRLHTRWPLYLLAAVALLAAPAVALALRPRAWRARLRAEVAALGDAAGLAALAPMALLPSLVVLAKPPYALPLLPLLLLVPGVAIATALECLEGERASVLLRRVSATMGCVLIAWSAAGQRPFDRPGRARPFYEAVQRLEEIWPARRVRLLGVGASSYASYLGRDRCVPIEPYASVSGDTETPRETRLDAMIRSHDADAVLVNRLLVEARGFDRSSLAVLTPERFRRYDLGDESIFFATWP
jgi:hypothetical protein